MNSNTNNQSKNNSTSEQTHNLLFYWKLITHGIRNILKQILAIEEVDYQAVIEDAKTDMVFRGHKAWILMFSILIASVGLNANSIPVIIGAMLISPLMGPIVAIGLSLGTYDFDTLKRAFKNLLIAVSISLITSAIYFWLTPLKEARSELLARTSPTILDVMIAFFGGFAGIIALARQERSNVIPGVAIATALMPPLCTAGYGLATWQGKFFFGALYLFFINSLFISLATYITVKYLRFPKKQFLSREREKRIRRLITYLTVIVIVPSAIMFFIIIKQSRFEANAQNFVSEVVKSDSSEILSQKFFFNDTTAIIELYFIGKPVDQNQIKTWARELHYYHLTAKSFFRKLIDPDTTIIKVYQSSGIEDVEQKMAKMQETLTKQWQVKMLEQLYEKNLQTIKDKDKKIALLEKELVKLKSDTIPLHQLYREFQIQYPDIEKFAYAKSVEINSKNHLDTIEAFIITWKPHTTHWKKYKEKKQLYKWLKVRLNLDTLLILEK